MPSSAGQGRERARRIGAVERALLVLDALGESGGEVGTNELARRTGVNASTVSRAPRDAGPGRVRRADRERPVPARPAAAPARQRRARRSRPPRARPTAARELARRRARRRRCRCPASGTRSRSTSSAARARCRASRRSVARACRTRPRRGRCCSRSGRAAPATARSSASRAHDRRSPARRAARGRAHGVRGLGRRGRGARARSGGARRPVRSSRGELVAILGLQGPSNRFDAAARARALPQLVTTAGETLSRRLGWTP